MAHNDGCNTALALLFDKNLSVNLFSPIDQQTTNQLVKDLCKRFCFQYNSTDVGA